MWRAQIAAFAPRWRIIAFDMRGHGESAAPDFPYSIDMLADDVLDGVHIFFPDPWHKARHNKRRLIQPPFVAQLVRKIKPGGYIHVATDWQDYAEQVLAVLSSEKSLENTAEDYAPRPAYRPLTKFEQRGLRLGHGVWDLVFKKL